MMTAEEFLKKLVREGGAIVCSNDLSAEDIAVARAEDRLWVDTDSYGYVFVPIEAEKE